MRFNDTDYMADMIPKKFPIIPFPDELEKDFEKQQKKPIVKLSE